MNLHSLFNIECDDHLQKFLGESTALLYLWFDWSPKSIDGKDVVLRWHERWNQNRSVPTVPLYLLDGDIPSVKAFLADPLRELGGFGSLHYFIDGSLVEHDSIYC